MTNEPQVAGWLTPIDIPDRYEFKYLIPEWQVDAVRRAVEPFCALDPNSARAPSRQYAIQSLYLDTFRRDLYRISCERRARHWKARIRRYDGSDRVFLEVKNKDHDMVKKPRAGIRSAGWVERVRGPLPGDADAAERLFRQRLARYQLVPTLMVRYLREAWSSTVDSYARVTFDRQVVCQPCADWCLDVDPRNWLALDGLRDTLGVPRGVVMEVKCLSAVPRWLSNVTRNAGLERARYSKYCRGIAGLYPRDALLVALDQT